MGLPHRGKQCLPLFLYITRMTGEGGSSYNRSTHHPLSVFMLQMAQIEHSTEVDQVGKEFLPEGFSLATDRGKDAKTVVSDPRKWKDRHNRTDLKGFDTRQAKEKKARKVLYQAGVGYIEQEPERFLKYISDEKGEFLDYNTFKDAVNKAFDKDVSLSKLKSTMKESDYQALFDTREVQDWLSENITEVAIPILMRKHNIERKRAELVWSKYPARKRGRIMTRILSGKRVATTGKRIKPMMKDSRVVFMTTSAGRRVMKPIPWTDTQEDFLKNNKGRFTIKQLHDWYNKIFSDARTLGSLRGKIYRMRLKK